MLQHVVTINNIAGSSAGSDLSERLANFANLIVFSSFLRAPYILSGFHCSYGRNDLHRGNIVTQNMWITLRRSLAHRNVIAGFVEAAHGRWTVLRSLSVSCGSNQADKPHVGIVGSGPAGFYTAQQILKVRTSMYYSVDYLT